MSKTNGRKQADEKPPITVTATPVLGRPGRFIAVALGTAGELFRDTIDLNSATGRKRFVAGAMRAAFKGKTPDEWPAEVMDALEARMAALASVPPGPPEPPAAAEKLPVDPRIEALAKMPADVRAEAARILATEPSLIDRVIEDTERLGMVGETLNRAIIYLVGTSAQLIRNPLACIVRGASSSGKTFVADRCSRFFPPEVVLHATSLTTNALYYFEQGSLRHRFVVAGERSRIDDDDQAEATRALREMIESGRLSKAVAVKEGDRIVTKVIEQVGPISYLETTTKSNVFDEDANRCLLLNTDEGTEQTRRIINATASSATGSTSADVARICAIHHAIQRMIPRVDVLVPFASAIGQHFPTKRIESRRDFRHLIQLVRACALLHFMQRERGPNREVIATMADYVTAEHLARGPLGTAASGISEEAGKLLAALRERFGERGDFTTTQAKQLPGNTPRTTFDRLKQLDGAGAVEQTDPGKGRVPATWRLTGIDPIAGDGILPTPEQVSETFSRFQHASNADHHAA